MLKTLVCLPLAIAGELLRATKLRPFSRLGRGLSRTADALFSARQGETLPDLPPTCQKPKPPGRTGP